MKCINNLEMFQNQATRFIAIIQSREVSDAKQRLGLISLQEWRQKHRFNLSMRILSLTTRKTSRAVCFDELMEQQDSSIQTRTQSRGLPRYMSTKQQSISQQLHPEDNQGSKAKLQHEHKSYIAAECCRPTAGRWTSLVLIIHNWSKCNFTFLK